MSSIFPPRLIKYNLQTQSDFYRNFVNSCKYGQNLIRFFASKVWQMVPMEMKNLKSLEDSDRCDCKLCKDFVSNLGYTSLVWLWNIHFTGYINFVWFQVLRNTYYVGICLLGLEMWRLQQGVKWVYTGLTICGNRLMWMMLLWCLYCWLC